MVFELYFINHIGGINFKWHFMAKQHTVRKLTVDGMIESVSRMVSSEICPGSYMTAVQYLLYRQKQTDYVEKSEHFN